MSEIQYRTLTTDNSKLVSQLIQSVLHEFIEKDLSPDGFQLVLDDTDEASIQELFTNEKTIGYGASLNDRLIGVCVIRDWSHVHFLFVAGAYHRRGIAQALFNLALADCLEKNPTLDILTVNSTLYAVDAYKKLGFVPIENGYHQHLGGTFVSMEMRVKG